VFLVKSGAHVLFWPDLSSTKAVAETGSENEIKFAVKYNTIKSVKPSN